MQKELIDLWQRQGYTALLVTHDVEEALYLSDRVIVLGKDTPEAPATIQRIVTVDRSHPRDRADAEITALRSELLAELGVEDNA